MLKPKELRPVREKPEYYEALEAKLIKWLKEILYVPALAELGTSPYKLMNSYDDLIQSIAKGQIQYVGAHFEGRFDARISKELKEIGAVWDRKNKWWTLPKTKLPHDVLIAIGTSESHFNEMAARLDRKLESISPKELAERLKLHKVFDTTIYKVNRDLNETMKAITIKPDLTDDQKAQISRDYTQNMQLYIQEFAEKEISELRQKIQKSSFNGGYRYEGMIKTIQESYGVSLNKAKFLARQETSLLMTKYKQVKYTDAGVNEYRWQCVNGSGAHPVRPMHKRLDGKIFTWDNPPIVDENGNRKHPGQDYNCRCVAVPIVKF